MDDDERRARAAERERRVAENTRVLAPVLADLRARGVDVPGLSTDFPARRELYVVAIPVLLSWLPRIENRDVRSDIVRTLTVPWAKGVATRPVLDEFYREPTDWAFRWTVGNAMTVLGTPTVVDEIANIARHEPYGIARQMFIVALGRLRAFAHVPLLIDLLGQDDVAGHAAIALGQLRATDAVQRLAQLAESAGPGWVRREAAKALKRISGKAGGTC